MKKYAHVAVIGIDGMGAFNRLADTPCMDRIFADGAVTYDALSMDPTISAENWGGMLIGADPAVHNLTNGYISVHPYRSDTLPTVFRRIREARPGACLVSAVHWSPINYGIVENNIGVIEHSGGCDEEVTEKIIEFAAMKPAFLFAQLDDVDGAGHHYGYGTPDYLRRISEIDALVGRIYEAYEQNGILQDTLFIVLADHGGYIRGHGGWTETEKKIFFGVSGEGVRKGNIPFAVTKDISALVLCALGLPVPEYTQGGYTSQVPEGIFEDYGVKYIMPEVTANPALKNNVDFNAPGGLKEIFGGSIKLCLDFENSLADRSGNCAVTENGNVKFYSNGPCGFAAEFGATGCVEIENAPPGGDFSLSFFLLVDKDAVQDVCVLGTKSPEGGLHQKKGFNLLLRNHSIKVQYGCGDDDTDTVTSFGSDGFSGWIHIVFTLDARTGETVIYLNGKPAHRAVIEPEYVSSIAGAGRLVIGDDTQMNFNKSRNIIFRSDDLLMFDRCLTDEDIEKLAAYYNI